MEIRKLRIFLTILFGCSIMTITAQTTFDKANKQFEMKAYDLAIMNFEKVLKEDLSCIECQFKMAECYRFMNKNLEAYDIYRELDGKYEEPEYFLAFGKTLKKLGKYEEAGDMFTHYAVYDRETGLQYAESCGFALDVIATPEQRRVELSVTNSSEDDFSCSSFNGALLTSSFRTDLDKSASTDYSLLYKIDGSTTKLLQDPLLGEINVASVSFDKSNQTCAYFKHKFANGMHAIQADEKNLAIFFAKIDGRANFLNEVPFAHNDTDYSNAFPFLSPDSKTLYFSSNRPGGFGGFDLYISTQTESGWSEPRNLGNMVNTAGNEISPMVFANQLFFASDFHFGLGGYDLFSCDQIGSDYTNPMNMGKGINSPEDDLYPYYSVKDDNFYFTSNRIGGKGKMDVYLASGKGETNYVLTTQLPAEEIMPEAFVLEEKENLEPKIQTVSYIENSIEEETISDVNKPMAVNLSTVDFSHVYASETKPVSEEKVEFKDYGLSTKAVSSVSTETVNTNTGVNNFETLSSELKEHTKEEAPYVVYDVKESVSNENAEQAFFIQLGAFRETKGNINQFGRLSNYGSLYRIFNNGVTKIRLGYFFDRNQAELVLSQIKQEGFGDAFITRNFVQDSQMEVVYPDYSSTSTTTNNYVSPKPIVNDVKVVDTAPLSTYKVRLAAYEDPIWFDVNKVKGIGNIEQWSKGKWTIFVLGGYSSMDNARHAQQKAIAKGFNEARIVLDDNGILRDVEY